MFPKTPAKSRLSRVFPTQVGMFPWLRRSSQVLRRFSPRRWGCFWRRCILGLAVQVFPTQVGMFLDRSLSDGLLARFPHAGGDVSPGMPCASSSCRFSPRRWGCFRYCLERSWLRRVFPTQVGMFLSRRLSIGRRGSFPHAGGDVSVTSSLRFRRSLFSPRRWGCFHQLRGSNTSRLVFPTQVGMFPKGSG